jgi:hypothetical protein
MRRATIDLLIFLGFALVRIIDAQLIPIICIGMNLEVNLNKFFVGWRMSEAK